MFRLKLSILPWTSVCFTRKKDDRDSPALTRRKSNSCWTAFVTWRVRVRMTPFFSLLPSEQSRRNAVVVVVSIDDDPWHPRSGWAWPVQRKNHKLDIMIKLFHGKIYRYQQTWCAVCRVQHNCRVDVNPWNQNCTEQGNVSSARQHAVSFPML